MIVQRKTVRFQDTVSDMAVYDAISDYRSLGFRSESHMVIEAVRQFISKSHTDLSPDELADLIVKKLSGTITVSSEPSAPASTEPETSDNAAFDAALSFLDSF